MNCSMSIRFVVIFLLRTRERIRIQHPFRVRRPAEHHSSSLLTAAQGKLLSHDARTATLPVCYYFHFEISHKAEPQARYS